MAYQIGEALPEPAADLTRAHAGTPARPALAIQINALQAMCRQVFGFRLAMIAIATPTAISHTAPGLPTWFIGSAVLVTFMGSYVLFRDWERFGPILLRHPWLLAVDALFGALLLITATPESTLAYVTVCTPLLAGLVHGWRGAAVFAALQVVIVVGVYATVPKLEAAGATALLLPGFCVIAGAVGVTLRNLLLRFGTATQALTEARARLAVSEAVEGERTRLAREMHDSVAKTLHGLALAADGLAGSAGRMDPPTVRLQAELVARAARRAAAESRELLSDLRREQGLEGGVDLIAELAAQAHDFTDRHSVTATFRRLSEQTPVPPVPQAVARQLVTVACEALENAHRHADPTYLIVLAGVKGDMLRVSVYDDGRGLPAGTTLEGLRRAGHFGLVGMVERAASIGARIRIGRGRAEKGTEVRVELPLAALGDGESLFSVAQAARPSTREADGGQGAPQGPAAAFVSATATATATATASAGDAAPATAPTPLSAPDPGSAPVQAAPGPVPAPGSAPATTPENAPTPHP
ncbi:sensor histidine kinase [Streptomyces californicus]|uniref:sensor histidine kinase n=1 Tax=Streptomyces californicus TaxID=67351 RepID=UPI001E2E432F|nr:histidine kinase [Streptomyces californicus]MCC0577430.1 histidine kinase [Streptomyces californicus]